MAVVPVFGHVKVSVNFKSTGLVARKGFVRARLWAAATYWAHTSVTVIPIYPHHHTYQLKSVLTDSACTPVPVVHSPEQLPVNKTILS